MAQTILMIEDAPTRTCIDRILRTENNHYLKKIEELANKKLRFFRDKELREEQGNMSNVVSKRPRSTPVGEDGDKKIKKKRRVPKKAVRTPVVNNEITERLKEFIVNELKGTELKLVIQKSLYTSDTEKGLNRLNMPNNQLETVDFLTADEKRILNKTVQKDKIEVPLVGPTLEVYEKPMELTMWHMSSTVNYVLKTNWHQFWVDNKLHLKVDSKIQVWSFRGPDQRLCFAVVCVENPEGEDVFDN